MAGGDGGGKSPELSALFAHVVCDGQRLPKARHAAGRALFSFGPAGRAGFALGTGTIVPVLLERSAPTIVDVSI